MIICFINFFVMSNKIDDQERVRSIQSRIISEFNRSFLDPASDMTDEDVVERTLFWILDQVKAEFARRLANIETCLRFEIMFRPVTSLSSVQHFFDIVNSALRQVEGEFVEKEVNHEA